MQILQAVQMMKALQAMHMMKALQAMQMTLPMAAWRRRSRTKNSRERRGHKGRLDADAG